MRQCIALLAVCLCLAPAVQALPPLHEAARDGRIDEVRRLVTQDRSLLEQRDEFGNNPLHWAAAHGQVATVKFLLAAGVSPDVPKVKPAVGDLGWTPLHQAAASGQVETLKTLLAAGADIDARDAGDMTPLHQAALHNRVETARLLIDAGTPVDVRQKDQVFPLETAAYFGHTAMVQLLISRGADVNGRVYEGNRPLHQAARTGQWAVMQMLVESGADLEARRDDGQTPLHVAAAAGQVVSTQALLAMGADVMATAKDGLTPLGLAQKSGQGGTAGLLTAHLAAVNDINTRIVARKAMNQGRAARRVVAEQVVYRNEFALEAVGSEWSSDPTGAFHAPLRTTLIPNTSKRILGDFGNQNVRLTLTKMPPHDRVTVALTLVIINTWDGNGIVPGIAPDLWEASVTDGPLLLRATFHNGPDNWQRTPLQSFPGEWPLVSHPGRTGAVGKNLLKLRANKDRPEGVPDTVYRLKFTFAHDKPLLILNFTGKGLQELDDESWAIRSIEVRATRNR